jgi:hypothetical protein
MRLVREEERLFTDNVMMGVYTGRLFHASRLSFEDFGISSLLKQPACLYPGIVLRSRMLSSIEAS